MYKYELLQTYAKLMSVMEILQINLKILIIRIIVKTNYMDSIRIEHYILMM